MLSNNSLNQWLDFAGLLAPLPIDKAKKLQDKLKINLGSKHTFLPFLITRDQFNNKILPALAEELDTELCKFISDRVEKTFDLRNTLKKLQAKIIAIVGQGNFSALWLDREAFSADSMEHRALITEAVIHIYSIEALQKIVKLFYQHKVPMIPYGEGGGYNMGVTPMVPAVTLSLRGISHISEIRPSRKNKEHFEISVGAGVPFKDLIAYLEKRGFVLRCDPNTPRAATGGIAATGSNGGRKAFEVIVHGRAIGAQGTAICFAADENESKIIESEPFLLARKFFSINNLEEFNYSFKQIQEKNYHACATANSQGVSIPLKGMKAQANMQAQQAQTAHNFIDEMADALTLPLSAFIGAEGTTGFIYEVTFEIERPLPYLQASQWNFSSIEIAIAATKAIKALEVSLQPSFFEIISGESIRRYLLQDFPGRFSSDDAAVIILAIEASSSAACIAKHQRIEALIAQAYKSHNLSPIPAFAKTACMLQTEGITEFENLRRPREELPKKLRTKCKTDMEIRLEYLAEVFHIMQNTQPKNFHSIHSLAINMQKQDVLFGHLSPNHTAIIHWNIGGFDLYDEEQADIAWDYLSDVFHKAQQLAPANERYPSAQFTGEHGVAGKAAFLWLNYLAPEDFSRMCAVKDILDPNNLFNPETLFLRTSHSRALRARLLNSSAIFIKEQLNNIQVDEVRTAENYAISEGLRCTRCNSCKICPVIDAEHQLAQEKKRKSNKSILPSKRNILMFMERIAHLRKNIQNLSNPQMINKIKNISNAMFKESAALLSKCFYCRRCDKACPVNIEIHPLTQAFHKMGKLPSTGSKLWGLLYERLMGEDFFKHLTYKALAIMFMVSKPILNLLRRVKFIPTWLKTYTVPPTISFKHYEPLVEGKKLHYKDNFVLISNAVDNNVIGHDSADPDTIYIRYRGCMDTFGKPVATTAVDKFFKEVLNARIVDLEKKMCCGFPFEADGLVERAKQLRFASMVEIAKCIYTIIEQYIAKQTKIPNFILFSNCPTCCEAINEMQSILKFDELRERVRLRAGISLNFPMENIKFAINDTAQIALKLLTRLKIPITKQERRIGLKVPCHNTDEATKSQLELLGLYFTQPSSLDRCCGLSGTGRLKHPRIGTKIAENLFAQIEEQRPQVVVSGCPSCRDGVKIQRDIINTEDSNAQEFEIAGIFEYIMKVAQQA